MIGYFYIFMTILLTVCGQFLLRWQLPQYGALPADWMGRIKFLLSVYTNLWVLTGLGSAFLGSMFWTLALTKFELSFAYPFMAGAFLLTVVGSILIFGETFDWHKVVGLSLVIVGLIIASQGGGRDVTHAPRSVEDRL